jgi:hypothetical protein
MVEVLVMIMSYELSRAFGDEASAIASFSVVG